MKMKQRFLTLFAPTFMVSVTAFAQCLSGVYTIGNSAGNNFLSFGEAITSLDSNGVCGPVTFLVSEDTYAEQLSIHYITGSSAINTIRFRSDPANLNIPIINSSPLSSNPYSILLDSALYITFDGIWINYNDPGSAIPFVSAAVLLRHGASHNTFTNCSLYASSFSGLVWGQEWYPVSSSFDDNEISNCSILLGNILMRGDLTQFASAGNRIINNRSQEGTTITLESMGSFLIQNNSLENTQTAPAITGFAISIIGCNNGGLIDANHVYGEWISGIEVFNCATVDTILVSNNMVSIGGTATGGSTLKGISVFGSDNISIYNNNVSINTSSLVTIDAAYYMQSTTNVRVANNNFCNFAGKLAMYYTNPSPTFTSDYNNFYSTSAPLIGTAFGTTYADLSAWQANLPARDQHSVSVDPLYVDSVDLHVAQIQLRNKAIALPQIHFDFDHEPRNALPDIGADEFAAATDSVWPGDANNDGAADATDLIPVGMYFNQQGPPRSIVSNAWAAYYSMPWNVQVPLFNDAKFADCNGDGIVDLNDTTALVNNFGSSHALRTALNTSTVKNKIHIVFQNDTVHSGNYLTQSIVLESINGNITDSIYSFCFSASIDSAILPLADMNFDKINQSWGVYANDFLAFANYPAQKNKLNVAITALDHQNKKPATLIDNLSFRFLNGATQGAWYHFPVFDAKLYDRSGNAILFTLEIDSVFIDVNTGINELPVIATDFFSQSNHTLTFHKAIDKVIVYNAIGQILLMESKINANNHLVIPAAKTSVNIIEIYAGNKIHRFKIISN